MHKYSERQLRRKARRWVSHVCRGTQKEPGRKGQWEQWRERVEKMLEGRDSQLKQALEAAKKERGGVLRGLVDAILNRALEDYNTASELRESVVARMGLGDFRRMGDVRVENVILLARMWPEDGEFLIEGTRLRLITPNVRLKSRAVPGGVDLGRFEICLRPGTNRLIRVDVWPIEGNMGVPAYGDAMYHPHLFGYGLCWKNDKVPNNGRQDQLLDGTYFIPPIMSAMSILNNYNDDGAHLCLKYWDPKWKDAKNCKGCGTRTPKAEIGTCPSCGKEICGRCERHELDYKGCRGCTTRCLRCARLVGTKDLVRNCPGYGARKGICGRDIGCKHCQGDLDLCHYCAEARKKRQERAARAKEERAEVTITADVLE